MPSLAKSLPAIMYHYVNDWRGGITLTPERFEDHCRALAQKGWHGISLAQAEAFLLGREDIPAKSILFTFDDGFLDNYEIAMSIMAKYGHSGVVFAVSNRLEPEDAPRMPVAEALAGTGTPSRGVISPQVVTPEGFILRQDVFMNHGEVRALDGAGVLSVASHSRGHYGVYAGPEYKDIWRPKNNTRTFYRTEEPPLWGMPDFSVKAGLKYRAFLPAPELLEAVANFVPQDFSEAAAFFADEANERGLREVLARFTGNAMGRFETDAERTQRMHREIVGGKAELEAILGHSVHTLCWPWGYYCEEAQSIAKEAGFSVFFTTAEGANVKGSADAVHRFKGKDKNGAWLVSRAAIYSRPLIGKLYASLRT